MDALPPYSLAVLATLLLLTLVGLRLRQRSVRKSRHEALDTLAGWPPQAARILTMHERQAFELLQRAMPGFLVLGQVPLSRFIRVPSRHSYREWMQRVGSLSADLVLCDSGSRVLAVVDVRSGSESERGRLRHERLARVLRKAGIHVLVWREGAFPEASEVRSAMSAVLAQSGRVKQRGKGTASRPMPLIPVGEINEVLAEGDAAYGAFDALQEPVPSGFYDEPETADAAR